jgi:hypothetical protein
VAESLVATEQAAGAPAHLRTSVLCFRFNSSNDPVLTNATLGSL